MHSFKLFSKNYLHEKAKNDIIFILLVDNTIILREGNFFLLKNI